jgi:hypothetical protein
MSKLADVLARLRADDGPPDPPSILPSESASSARFSSVVSPEGFLAMLEMMIGDPRYNWAFDTLAGIADTVSKSGWVSESQRQAVYNIRHAADRKEEEKRDQRFRHDGDGYLRNFRG